LSDDSEEREEDEEDSEEEEEETDDESGSVELDSSESEGEIEVAPGKTVKRPKFTEKDLKNDTKHIQILDSMTSYYNQSKAARARHLESRLAEIVRQSEEEEAAKLSRAKAPKTTSSTTTTEASRQAKRALPKQH
jgi:hypothetical protein